MGLILGRVINSFSNFSVLVDARNILQNKICAEAINCYKDAAIILDFPSAPYTEQLPELDPYK